MSQGKISNLRQGISPAAIGHFGWAYRPAGTGHFCQTYLTSLRVLPIVASVRLVWSAEDRKLQKDHTVRLRTSRNSTYILLYRYVFQ